jgi:hypothetical protein
LDQHRETWEEFERRLESLGTSDPGLLGAMAHWILPLFRKHLSAIIKRNEWHVVVDWTEGRVVRLQVWVLGEDQLAVRTLINEKPTAQFFGVLPAQAAELVAGVFSSGGL